MVLNRAGLAFVGRRIGGPEHVDTTHVWQMPQGGIDSGEEPWPAALRELREETNMHSVERLGEIARMAQHTTFRAELVGQAWNGKYRGQKQKWFAMRFTRRRRAKSTSQHPGGRARAGIRGVALGAAAKRSRPRRAVQARRSTSGWCDEFRHLAVGA